MNPAVLEAAAKLEGHAGIRTHIIASYDIPRAFYATCRNSAAIKLRDLGILIYYAIELGHNGHRKRTIMDVDKVVERWAEVVVGLATAHDKDDADRYEAAIEECLVPILAAPIKQIREFYPKLLARMKTDPKIPFLVWRSYEIWVDMVLRRAPDEAVLHLKTQLATEIAAMVEQDVKDQIPEQLIRALQWRSEETLESVKETVREVKAGGGKVKLRGRESCLFMEAGGTDENPKVCVQI